VVPAQRLQLNLKPSIGTPAGTPAGIAEWEVEEAIKLTTGIGDPIINQLVFLDFVHSIVHKMTLDD